MAHLKMMAACQPFLSGAISKTVNLPNSATVEDIMETYQEAWRLGVKAVAIYRDGCKRSQPLSTKKTSDVKETTERQPAQMELVREVPVEKIVEVEKVVLKPFRRKLPDERQAITHKFNIAGHEGYVTVGMYEDGQPGEVFITMAKEGSTISGLMDAFATAISLSLQYGVPLQVLVDKFTATRFEPSGFTGNKDIPLAKSVTDYLFRWLALKFLQTPSDDQVAPPTMDVDTPAVSAAPVGAAPVSAAPVGASPVKVSNYNIAADTPLCSNCGHKMFPAGKCYRCDCGNTSGGCS